MEKNQERVLAYQLAKQLDDVDLENVAGGGGMAWNMTHNNCGHLSGTNGQWDVSVDISLDW